MQRGARRRVRGGKAVRIPCRPVMMAKRSVPEYVPASVFDAIIPG